MSYTIGFILLTTIFLGSLVSLELGLSVTIIEIIMGAILGNTMNFAVPEWMSFLAAVGSVLLTFLAGAEVDPDILKNKAKESFFIGFISFLAPFVLSSLYCYYLAHWSLQAALIAGVALSTTSLAVVYAVLVETGLTKTELGKLIMASCFVTDMGTVVALTLIFSQYSLRTLIYVLGSLAVLFLFPPILHWVRQRYGDKMVQPDVKLILAALLLLMLLAELGQGQSVLPAFILGLCVSRSFTEQPKIPTRLRNIAFAMLTPFFFIKAGMHVSFAALFSQLGLLGVLFLLKIGAKCVGIYPLAQRYMNNSAVYTTLLMSTGLTFGTISATYGLNNGFIDQSQFSLLVTVVVASAVIPTTIAQKWFQPVTEESEAAAE